MWWCSKGIARRAFSTLVSTVGWDRRALHACGQLSTFCSAPAHARRGFMIFARHCSPDTTSVFLDLISRRLRKGKGEGNQGGHFCALTR
jgi:hypothetical protein